MNDKELSPPEDMKPTALLMSYQCSGLVQVSDAKFPKRVSNPTLYSPTETSAAASVATQ